MNAYPGGFSWRWYYGETEASLKTLITAKAARIYDLKTYVLNGTRRFAVLMLGNSWDAGQAA
jgi:hypothetical protein